MDGIRIRIIRRCMIADDYWRERNSGPKILKWFRHMEKIEAILAKSVYRAEVDALEGRRLTNKEMT